MKYIIILTLIVATLYGCTDAKIAQPKDYNAYLNPNHLARTMERNEDEISFWQQRLATDTGSYVNLLELGFNYLGRFKLTGGIHDLKAGDSLLKHAAAKLNHSDPDILQALSQVAITQHQFKEAALYNQQAFEKEASPFVHALLSFDVGIELGQYGAAKGILNILKDETSFNYLIREAKYKDHRGDLDGAIALMETAFKKVAATNKTSLYCWTLSNLGDMYGHAGRIKESYAAYLGVLQKDPAYLYALKGIAWIAYAHDKNPVEAKRIISFLQSITNDPSLYLTLAEIASYQMDNEEKEQQLEAFLSAVADPAYKGMYNKMLIEIYTEEKTDLAKAMQLAEKEVANRPTPETYSWLAWVHFKRGDVRRAHELFVTHVKGRSFEPEVLLKGAYITEAAGETSEAKALFEECLESSFELGPVKSSLLKEKVK